LRGLGKPGKVATSAVNQTCGYRSAGARVFGEIVRAHRRRLGLSQEELAGRAGVSVRSIGKLETGRIVVARPATVRLLADAFGLTGADRDRFCAAASAEPTSSKATGQPPERATAPAQLPLDVYGFTGRVAHLDALDRIAAAAGDQPTAVVISAIAGTAGVGKTALAVHWAHRVRGGFPDGQLYVNLRGFDPSGTVMDPVEAIRRFLDALGVPPGRIPADPDAQVGLYRTLLAGKRMLIVLDNARDPDQVGPLLPGAPGCLVLVTSRNHLSGLVATMGAHPIALDLLAVDEAWDLLAHRFGPGRVAAEPDATDEIITCCARLPLALAIAAANAATQPRLSLAAIATDLRDSHDRLGVLSTGDTPSADVRAVFSWSYHILTPVAARLFRLLGLHPGPDISTPAAASLAALPIDQTHTLLTELARANLIVEPVPGRYAFHDLLRAYATNLAHTTDPEEQRHAVTHRILDHYLHTSYIAHRLLDPVRDPLVLGPPQPDVVLDRPAGHEQALDWFAAEHAVLLAAVDHAAATGFDSHTWQLASTLDTFLARRGHWRDLAAIWRAAVAAAERLADPTAQAHAYRFLAHAYTLLGHLDDAHTPLRRGLALTIQTGDLVGQAHLHHSLTYVLERQARHTAALDHARQALDLYRAAGHRRGQASALNVVGWYHAQLGDHQQALTACRQALTLFQELDDRDGYAATWDSLGYAHHHLGDHTQAIACYQHAVDLVRNLGDRYNEATILTHLGDTHHVTGDAYATRTAWQQALTILDELDHPDADGVQSRLRGLAT
jgi:tetratricopeptide (TPR) repeat protein/transcriptional regulator with XRE-family HTH domain